MEAFFIHLLKSSFILLLFLFTYYVFLKKETFFSGNRLFLLSGLLISFILPFIHITKTIIVEPSPLVQSDLFLINEVATNTTITSSFNWTTLLVAIYLIGVLYFSIKLITQLTVIKKIKRISDIIEDDNFYHVKTKKQISPFSFFKHIFYHPKQFKGAELNTIIEHEKVHARELHSIDIIFTELLFIILWFNPIIWFYRIIIKQNLEFLADAKTCKINQDKKFYQYLMLKQAVGSHNISIANPFYNSIIKKRIVMLNQNQSKSINRLKLLLVLPFLGLFLFGFNTKEVIKFSEKNNNKTSFPLEQPAFISPLKQEDIKKVTFGFGETNNTAGVKFHNGIDIVGLMGTDVMASADGVVKISTKGQANGNYIVIEHEDGYSTKYMHLKDRLVNEGEKVNSGSIIAHVGNTGNSTGPHLHFEILQNNKPINPASLIPFKDTEIKKTNLKNSSKKSGKVSSSVKTIKLTLNKNTTDESLLKMKEDLAKDGADFSYTVVRNSDKEIIDINIQISGEGTNGEKFNGNYNTSSDTPINPITILYDDENNAISFWNGDSNIHKIKRKKQNAIVWIDSDEDDKSRKVVVKTINGKKTITVDGEEVDEDELKEMNIFKNKDGESENVKIHVVSDGDDDEDENVFIIENKENDNEDVKILFSVEGDKKKRRKAKRLYYLDGDKITEKEMKALSPDNIASMSVFKGEATKLYGKEGEDGVIEITSKNKNKIFISKDSDNIEIEKNDNVFIVKTDDAGDYDEDIKFVSKGPKPLFIVDGKEIKKFKNTNPNEIESINVLKGKAARKKYGRKAKNGVVEIITKKEK